MINDARIPQNPGAYMQLVTDGEGNAQWEKRLGYVERNTYFEWDGSTQGREVIENTFSPVDNVEWPLTFYKVSDAYMSAEELIGSVMTVSNAESIGLPNSVTIQEANVSTGYGATSTPVLNVAINAIPLIMSMPSGNGTHSEGVYVLLAKAEELSEIMGNPFENDVFASNLAKETIHKIPENYTTEEDIEIVGDGNGGYTASIPFEEAWALSANVLQRRVVVYVNENSKADGHGNSVTIGKSLIMSLGNHIVINVPLVYAASSSTYDKGSLVLFWNSTTIKLLAAVA